MMKRVVMYSARHKAEAHLTPANTAMIWQVAFPKGNLAMGMG
jgi:hypothetical protein